MIDEMLYSIVRGFSPDSIQKWEEYIQWRGLVFKRFDSIDGELRQSLFEPLTDEDWENVVQENCMMSFFTNYDYAKKKHLILNEGELVGLRLKKHDELRDDFLGYDLLDRCFDVSVLTNWVNDDSLINGYIADNGLVKEKNNIELLKKHTELNYGVSEVSLALCNIVSLYKVYK